MTQNPHKPLFLSPHWLRDIGANPAPDRFRVFAVPYTSANRPLRIWEHRTLRAAGRRMGSVISGKLAMRADHAVFCLAPDGTIHNWNTANGKVTQ